LLYPPVFFKVKTAGCLIFKKLSPESPCLEAEFYFFGAILYYSQSGNDPQEDLAKFGYKLNMKAM
jgi:hypothetical protein